MICQNPRKKSLIIYDENEEIIFNETSKWVSVDLVGGVLIFPFDLFHKINGYSNRFVGWGGEDDDMRFRLAARDVVRISGLDFCHARSDLSHLARAHFN